MKNKKGRSLISLFIINFIFSIIAVILSVAVYSLSNDYQSAINAVQFQGYPIGIFFSNRKDFLFRNEDYNEFINSKYKENILKNKGWVEIVVNGEVKEVIGNKKDKIMKYKVGEYGIELDSFIDNTYENDYNFEEHINEYKSNEDYIENIDLGYQQIAIEDIYNNNTYYVIKIPYKNITDEEAQKEISKTTLKKYIFSIIPASFIFISIMGICLYLSIKSIKKPLKEIERGISEIRNGNLNDEIDFYSYKQMNEIKDMFNYMSKEMLISNTNRIEVEESKKKMIRDISHDIKTPLTSIMGYSKAIIDKENMSEEERDLYLQYIYKKTVRINNLCNELFKFVELDSSNYKLNKVKKDYCEFIREVISIYYKDIEDKKFNLELDISEKEILLEFDSENLERALGNLIVNVLKYNSENTILKISVKEENNKIKTIIEDDGIGIDYSLCKTIFDEFARGDESRNSTGGSGLGLAITKKIITLHDGEIYLESDINKGCKFTIIL